MEHLFDAENTCAGSGTPDQSKIPHPTYEVKSVSAFDEFLLPGEKVRLRGMEAIPVPVPPFDSENYARPFPPHPIRSAGEKNKTTSHQFSLHL